MWHTESGMRLRVLPHLLQQFRGGIEPLGPSGIDFEPSEMLELAVKRALKVLSVLCWMLTCCEVNETQHVNQLVIRRLNT